jgi:hypothetical protein
VPSGQAQHPRADRPPMIGGPVARAGLGTRTHSLAWWYPPGKSTTPSRNNPPDDGEGLLEPVHPVAEREARQELPGSYSSSAASGHVRR